VASSRRLTQAFAATGSFLQERFLQSIVFPDATLLQKIPCDNKFLRHASALRSRIQVVVIKIWGALYLKQGGYTPSHRDLPVTINADDSHAQLPPWKSLELQAFYHD